MKAHWSYLRYLIRHKWYVLLAGLRTGAPLWRLLIHDWSKFTPAEWGPYVRMFYGRFQVGRAVEIHSHKGVHGTAVITNRRPSTAGGRWEVQMRESGVKFWAWDHEVVGFSAVLDNFDHAWLHHQHHNPHHWQYWILKLDDGTSEPLQMPEAVVREMVADWAGAGRAITGRWDIADWYRKNSAVIDLHPASSRLVLKLMGPLLESRGAVAKGGAL